MIKKADIALFFILLILGLAASCFSVAGSTAGSKVIISVDGEVFGAYDINKNQTIEVKQNGHTNNITIKDGLVSMSYSDCANQVCVHTGSIKESSDTIVCLPNKVMVEISAEGGPVDVVSD